MENVEIYLDVILLLQAMEDLVHKGLVKAIGLSNFNESQIDRILRVCTIKPVALQVEVSVNWLNEKVIDFCKQREIRVIAFGVLRASSPSR